MRLPYKGETLPRGMSVPVMERASGLQPACISGVKEILVEVLPRSRSSSQEERHIVLMRNNEKQE
ncbi:hypothetical protein ACIW9X_21295 [Bacteroides fragilis]